MSAQPALRLVTPSIDSSESVAHAASKSLKLERRGQTRYSVSGRVTALRSSLEQDGMHNQICSLQMINMSESGMAAMVQDALEPNTSIAIFFPPHGPERGFDRYGHVVRCVQKGYGHEIGIRFDTRPAA